QMNGYVNALSGTPILSSHTVSSGQNSLQGALKSTTEPVQRTPSTSLKSPNLSAAPILFDAKVKIMGSSAISASLDQDMQRQLADYNRSITIVVWYQANTEPIRLQHMNSMFPYFKVLQLDVLVRELALSPKSLVETYDPQSGTWEQHQVDHVRIVTAQQRLLYRLRRSFLAGLGENECPGLREEVAAQSSTLATKHEQQTPTHRKRPSTDHVSSEPAQKVHVPNHYYAIHSASPTAIPPVSVSVTDAPGVMYVNGYTSCPPQIYYPPTVPAVAGTAAAASSSAVAATPLSVQATPPASTASTITTTTPSDPSPSPPPLDEPHIPSMSTPMHPIPYHTHPPLKRWPNDYTVSELTNGFRAMEVLVRDGGSRGGTGTMTQRAAFERVFGSRYVKSTVCRHRGVWRKAAGPLREQFESMGSDERACWGEFVRRVEGRPPGKAIQVQVQMQMQSVGGYQPRVGSEVVAEARTPADVPSPEEPAMASLQDTDGQGTASFG
ncbi:hypothetical protein C0991_008230, partial [Blastosporella zonata]